MDVEVDLVAALGTFLGADDMGGTRENEELACRRSYCISIKLMGILVLIRDNRLTSCFLALLLRNDHRQGAAPRTKYGHHSKGIELGGHDHRSRPGQRGHNCDGVQLHPFMGVSGAGEESSFLSLSLGEKGGRHSMIDSNAGAIPRWEGG